MTIKIYPEDIVKMCLWDHYVYYILGGSDKEAQRILSENEEIEVSEKDALVIGLLKVIETDNLIHKFNGYVMELLTNKSLKEKELLLVRKKALDASLDKFVDKFPDYWEPNLLYTKSLKELVEYIDAIKLEIEKLEIHKIVDKNITYEFYNSNNIKKLLKFNTATPVIQAISQIIAQSSYLENALTKVYTDAETTGPDAELPKNNSQEIAWYNLSARVKSLAWDDKVNDFAVEITYVIQPYLTPVVTSSYVNKVSKYYGPHKRYEYWYTGKNSEILSYEQTLNHAYVQAALDGASDKDTVADIATILQQRTGGNRLGTINNGLEAQNAYMTSLFSPRDFGNARIRILGDPDFLMQPAPSSINDLYSQFYGTDRFTINPNGGQVFIEINFKEPVDYQNSTGTMSLNDSIYFWKYPESIQKALNSRGGGISYMVKQVNSSFSKGKFEQELVCSLNTFGDPGPDKTTTDQGRPSTVTDKPGENQMADTASRAGSGSATTPDGTATTSNTGFNTSANSMSLDPAQIGKAGLLGSVGSINNVMDPMQRLSASSVTIQTQQGPVVNDDAGLGPR